MVVNDFIHGDALSTSLVPKESIDMIITSPPYNVGKEYSKDDALSDAMEYDDYINKFTAIWMSNCHHWAKPGARLCVNIFFDSPRDGRKLIFADIDKKAIEAGWQYRSIILWKKSTGRRTCWGSWASATAPNIVQPFEAILIYNKGDWKREEGSSTITGDEFKEWTQGIWEFRGEVGKSIGHPAPFPGELPKRLLKLFSFENDVVLDPFMGSGTTALACADLGRHFIGIEKEAEFVKLARNRMGLL